MGVRGLLNMLNLLLARFDATGQHRLKPMIICPTSILSTRLASASWRSVMLSFTIMYPFKHILHFWRFWPCHEFPFCQTKPQKNALMSPVLPSSADSESAVDWISTSMGVPSSLSASESVAHRRLYGFWLMVLRQVILQQIPLTFWISTSVFTLFLIRVIHNKHISSKRTLLVLVRVTSRFSSPDPSISRVSSTRTKRT
ncbi:hypothetical protein JB92DRAFT_2970332 [Gautieria morchelliformis]|nr:hypothetical protein JB92DRAFT_2970332 [Gautieria morchelliformis]